MGNDFFVSAPRLRRDSLGCGMGLRRQLGFLPVLLAVDGCGSFRSPRPQLAPLTPALRHLYGCYAISFDSVAEGLDAPWGEFRAGPWRIRLDSAIAYDSSERLATFLAPKVKWPPRLSWAALPRESLFVRTQWGVEGQGIEVRTVLLADSLSGRAVEYWSLGNDPPRSLGPTTGARIPCPSSRTTY